MFNLLGNDTLRSERHWTPNPEFRGTWSIIWTSLITLVLFLWISLRLDVPSNVGIAWPQPLRKLFFCLVGVLCPEWLAYKALSQLLEAQLCKREFQECFQSQGKTSQDIAEKGASTDAVHQVTTSPVEWTLAHSFLAISGGFVLPHGTYHPHARRDMRITSSGWQFIFRHCPQFVPSITSKELQDHSSTSWILHFLVCFQVFFFCMDLIIRLSTHHGVSLFEINVLAHCFFALTIYICWWYKPQNIQRPIVLESTRGTGYPPLIHYCSQDKLGRRPYNIFIMEAKKTEVHVNARNARSAAQKSNASVGAQESGEQYADTCLNPDFYLLWVKQNLDHAKAHAEFKSFLDERQFKSFKEAYLGRFFTHPGLSELAVFLCIMIFSFPYGLLHFLGWSSNHHSDNEVLLWRISIIVLLTAGPAVLALFPLLRQSIIWMDVLKYKQEEWPEFSFLLLLVEIVLMCPFTALFWAIGLAFPAYTIARAVLVIQSIIQLGYLPESAFAVVSWARYFPHF